MLYISTNCHKCVECANTKKKIEKILKIQQGE